ncbi:hypothetical protein COOONC_27575, partial [Cooperia oncophora]
LHLIKKKRKARFAQAPSEPGDTEENQSPEKSAAADAASDSDSDTSDEGVVDDRRASPKKKRPLKRKV